MASVVLLRTGNAEKGNSKCSFNGRGRRKTAFEDIHGENGDANSTEIEGTYTHIFAWSSALHPILVVGFFIHCHWENLAARSSPQQAIVVCRKLVLRDVLPTHALEKKVKWQGGRNGHIVHNLNIEISHDSRLLGLLVCSGLSCVQTIKMDGTERRASALLLEGLIKCVFILLLTRENVVEQ